MNPEGLTAACGEHAETVAARLRAGGLSCKVLDRITFKQVRIGWCYTYTPSGTLSVLITHVSEYAFSWTLELLSNES